MKYIVQWTLKSQGSKSATGTDIVIADTAEKAALKRRIKKRPEISMFDMVHGEFIAKPLVLS